ncbi:MAG: hypothetical protein ACOCYB_06685 [Alkalispirochaeta sp.]
MFENILGLESVVADLARDVEHQRLPHAIMLAGPRYGGKSSVALELARVLTCHEHGQWGCSCRSCRLQRGLQHRDTVLAGDRYFELEISAARRAFEREPRAGTAFLLVRAVRKLLRRFDSFMWPETRLKKVESAMTTVEEALEQIEPADHRDAPWSRLGPRDLANVLDAIDEQVVKLQQQLPHDPVPVDLVRALASWAHLSSAGGAKVLVIEEAHQLQEGARNAMLKLLEEPPEGLTIIFTTSRRTAVIPTVLSRLRIYNLPERPPEVQREVQEKIYRVAEPDQPLLQPFFRRSSAAALGWREVAHEILQAISQPGGVARLQVTLREQLSQGPPRKAAEYLLDALLEELRGALRSISAASLNTAQVTVLSDQVRAHWDRIATRNMNPVSVIESLLIAMSRTVRGAR